MIGPQYLYIDRNQLQSLPYNWMSDVEETQDGMYRVECVAYSHSGMYDEAIERLNDELAELESVWQERYNKAFDRLAKCKGVKLRDFMI